MKKLTLLLAIICSTVLFAEPQNGVIYVKAGASGTGASWSDAMGDIQAAITLAKSTSTARKDVWVAAGEFTISTALNIVDSVNVYGSFAGTETTVAARSKVANGKAWEFVNPTTLKGSGARLFQAVGNMDMETIIDGFILRDGNGVGSTLSASGGAAVARGNVVYQNCIMRNNAASGSGSGGAIIMTGGTVRYCLFENNTQSGGANGGGAIFTNPAAGFPVKIENCVVRNNTTTVRGGGIAFQGVEFTNISNVKVYNNAAIDGTTLKGGGGLYANSTNNRVINSVVYNNAGASSVYLTGGNFVNNTVVKNVGGLYANATTFNIVNNIVWGCAVDATGAQATGITGVSNSASVAHNNATYNPITGSWDVLDNFLLSSNVSNGDVVDPAQGTLGSGPKFNKVTTFIGIATTPEQVEELETADWSLNGNSPLKDLGKTMAIVTNDFDGLTRPQGYPIENAKYDIGAYELAYYKVVAGEASDAKGKIYDALGVEIAQNSVMGFAKGSKLELYFFPNTSSPIYKAYYTVSTDNGMTFTGSQVDFTSEISTDGLWLTTVKNSFKVSVEWLEPNAVKSLNDLGVQCFGINNGIQLNGLTINKEIKIYNMSGMQMNKITAEGTNLFVPLNRGVYFVVMNEGSQKVIVK